MVRKHDIVLIEGDGIGLETSASMKKVLSSLGLDINWIHEVAGLTALENGDKTLPDKTVDAIMQYKVAIKGPVTTPVGKGFRSVNVGLRQSLNLFACLRPVLSIPNVGSRYKNIDLVIVRENTEDLYKGIEFEQGSKIATEFAQFCKDRGINDISADAGISIKPISVSASKRIAQFAFNYAVDNSRDKVCAVHKANIMKFSDGLFLQTVGEVAKNYENKIKYENRIVDAFCMNMVCNPEQFDVVLLPNLYGDIASDLAAGLVGGLGIAPGANIGQHHAVFEAVHGSAPDIAGKNLANPTAQLLSSAMMLDHIGENAAASTLRDAIHSVYLKDEVITGDIRSVNNSSKSASSCSEFTDNLISEINKL